MKLSIITVNLNNLEGLKRTYDSIVCQTFTDYEWIVIDGGSTDGSREFIEEHQNTISYWCSEPDKGIYNAMNKGVRHAHGQYCLFMNSGDHFYGNKTLRKAQRLQWDCDFISFDIIFENNPLYKYQKAPKSVSESFFIHSTLPHQSTLIRTLLLQQFPYQENLKIASDWLFFYESLAIRRCTYQAVHMPLSVFYFGGVSSDSDLCIQERYKCLQKYHLESLLQETTQKQSGKKNNTVYHLRCWIYRHIVIYVNYVLRKLSGKL